MGLFNRFRRRVKETVDASDAEGMLADEGSDEANAALQAREAVQEQSATPQPTPSSDDDWDDPETTEPAAEDDWDEPEDDWELPRKRRHLPPWPNPAESTGGVEGRTSHDALDHRSTIGGGRSSASRLDR